MNTISDKEFLNRIEKYFDLFILGDDVELEACTENGEYMFINLYLNSDMSLSEQFRQQVASFNAEDAASDVEDSKRTESIEDYEVYKQSLLNVLEELSNSHEKIN